MTATSAPPRHRRRGPGARNGYRPVTVKTTAGPVTLERPQLRGTTAAFASRLFGKNVTRTNALESLVIASFVRGLSVRDVEATLADALGDQARLEIDCVAGLSRDQDRIRGWAPDASTRSCWTTCSWTPRSSGCIRLRRPSRSWPRGASPPPVSPWSRVGTRVAGESDRRLGRFPDRPARPGLACPLLVISDGPAA